MIINCSNSQRLIKDQRLRLCNRLSRRPCRAFSLLGCPRNPPWSFLGPSPLHFLDVYSTVNVHTTFARDLSSTGRWRRHPGVAFRSTTLCVAFSSSTIGNKHSQLPLMEMPRDGAGGGWAGPTLRPDLAPAKRSTHAPDVPCVTRHVLSVT